MAHNPASQGSAAANPPKSTSPHVSRVIMCPILGRCLMEQVKFYKNLGRPIAKVFLGSVFVYQGIYWLWLKMETEEIKAKKHSELFPHVMKLSRLIWTSQAKSKNWKVQ